MVLAKGWHKVRAAVSLLLCAASVWASSPADAVAAALADAGRLPPDARAHARYLSLYHESDAKRLGEQKKVLDFWVNSLSREAELKPLVEVRPGLYRLDLRDYRWDAKTWERLADEPYFHARIKTAATTTPAAPATVEVIEWWPGGNKGGVYYPPGNYRVQRPAPAKSADKVQEEVKVAQAPWLDTRQAAELVTLTQSQAPVVRGDWWLVQTAQQADRKGTGYYDFLNVKDLKEFQRAVGLDQKLAEELQRETRAIVSRSGVTLNNRQILRYQTITGGYWATLDSNKNTNGNNAVRQLNGDYSFDATEVYGALPSGLFAFFLADSKGVRQDAAPDSIASDGQAPGNDRRVHAGVSCVRCHVEGIRPIDDWARKVYRSPIALASPDHEKLQRLRRLYLSDLDRHVRRDQQDYAEVLGKLTGLKPQEMARAFARMHEQYRERDLGLAQAAREAGVDGAKLLAALKVYATANGSLDPVLAGLLQEPEVPIRREHYEEAYSLLQTVLRGYRP